jgi:hypothetical protein
MLWLCVVVVVFIGALWLLHCGAVALLVHHGVHYIVVSLHGYGVFVLSLCCCGVMLCQSSCSPW